MEMSNGKQLEIEKLKFEKTLEDIKKRKRKSNGQLKVLKLELEKESFWDKEKITQVSLTTGLSESQVYKWFWDQKKKKAEINREQIIEKKRNLLRKGRDHIKEFELIENRKKIKGDNDLDNHGYKALGTKIEAENVSKKLKFEAV